MCSLYATERIYPQRNPNILRLDVGCGLNWCGSVNVDLYVEPTKHDVSRSTLPTHKIPNFIVADCQHLPFKSEMFDEVACLHLLEHVMRPFDVLIELRRVLKKGKYLILEIPNASDVVERNREMHLYTWNKFTARNILVKAGFAVEDTSIYGTEIFPMARRYAPALSRILTFLFPNKSLINLRLIAKKNG